MLPPESKERIRALDHANELITDVNADLFKKLTMPVLNSFVLRMMSDQPNADIQQTPMPNDDVMAMVQSVLPALMQQVAVLQKNLTHQPSGVSQDQEKPSESGMSPMIQHEPQQKKHVFQPPVGSEFHRRDQIERKSGMFSRPKSEQQPEVPSIFQLDSQRGRRYSFEQMREVPPCQMQRPPKATFLKNLSSSSLPSSFSKIWESTPENCNLSGAMSGPPPLHSDHAVQKDNDCEKLAFEQIRERFDSECNSYFV